MSILQRIRTTDRMLQIVDDLSRQAGMQDAAEFHQRIMKGDQAADVTFLEMAEMLWTEHREMVEAFYRHYFHQMSRDGQCRVAYMTAGSFLDRSAAAKTERSAELFFN